MYDYYIELHLTTVNGKALEKLISTPKQQQVRDTLNLDGIDGLSTEAI